MADRATTAPAIWSLGETALTCVEPGEGRAIVLVPSEQVATASLDLPLASRARRAAALPFAIEDMLAEPIEQVHLALGAETAPRRHVSGAVSHATMRIWVDRIEAEGLSRAAIMPDALVLPLPEPGGWSVAVGGARVRIRTSDGAGFAVPLAQLVTAWEAAGRPRCLACGEPLPEAMALSSAEAGPEPIRRELPLDLRQGAYAPRRGPIPAVGRRLLTAVAAGLAAHLAILGADVMVLRHRVEQRREGVRALVGRLAPGAVIGDDVAGDAAALLPDGSAPAAGGFLPLLARAAAALKPLAAVTGWRGLAYSAADGTLTLQVEAADMGTLQRVRTAFVGAGLRPSSGAASTDLGRATGEFTLSARDHP